MSGESEGHTVTDAAERLQPAPLSAPRHLSAWMAELLSVPLGAVEAYLPCRRAIGAGTREQLIVAVAEAHGVRSTAWVHGAWLDFIGARDPDDLLEPMFDYARSCAEAGRPLDATSLETVYPQAVVRSLRATVAVAHLTSAAGASADDVWARALGRRRGAPARGASHLLGVGLALPLLAPTVALAGTMRVLTWLAPELPEIELPPEREANLVVHLLAEAAPAYLGHALVRTGLLLSPLPVAIAFRMDGTSATIRFGRGRVRISNGIQPDALAVVDGAEPLAALAAGSILRDLGVPVRRRS
jgi:hypothetical protein